MDKADFTKALPSVESWVECPECKKQWNSLTTEGFCVECQDKKREAALKQHFDYKVKIKEAISKCHKIILTDLELEGIMILAEKYNDLINCAEEVEKADEWLLTSRKTYKLYARFLRNWWQNAVKYKMRDRSIQAQRSMYKKEEEIKSNPREDLGY